MCFSQHLIRALHLSVGDTTITTTNSTAAVTYSIQTETNTISTTTQIRKGLFM